MDQAVPVNAPVTWPNAQFTRTPYEVYTSEEIFTREQQLIFNGPTWVILGLECEVDEPGKFTRSSIGTTPVVLSCGEDGNLHAFVNRCAHRGAQVVRELRGSSLGHTCLYHGWRYDSAGHLKVAPMAKGVMGNGGYPEDFKVEDHCMRRVAVETHAGAVFGSLHENPPPLREYLGDAVADRLSKIIRGPLKVWGYQRQTMACNWKLFMENTRDMYHAPLLHDFAPRFGLVNPARQRDTLQFGHDGAHQLYSTYRIKDGGGDAPPDRGAKLLTLEEPDVAQGVEELPDGMSINIISIFPATLFTFVANTLSFRQVRPIAPNKCETVYTWFQFEDDDAEMHNRRVMQSNLFGPAGFIAMEDAEVMEWTQKSIANGGENGTSFIEMGGREVAEGEHGITEASVRGFWKTYCRYMEIPANDQPGAAE